MRSMNRYEQALKGILKDLNFLVRFTVNPAAKQNSLSQDFNLALKFLHVVQQRKPSGRT